MTTHADTHQTYDDQTDPMRSFVTHCTCGHVTRGMDPDDADALMLAHTRHPAGAARTFAAHDGETRAVVHYPERPDTADRDVHAYALDGPVTVLGPDDEAPLDAYRVRTLSGAVFTAWTDELEN